MKVAVSSEGPSAESAVCPRFGRCPYFVVMDIQGDSFSALENIAASMGSGAGTQAAQLLSASGVEYVLTGDCGPKAFEALGAAGIGVALGCSGTVRQAVEGFAEKAADNGDKTGRSGPNERNAPKAAETRSSNSAGLSTAGSCFAQTGRGQGAGRGFGRGLGRGAGRGLGRRRRGGG
jgi:predicted Fe-Mo cluster-binding NifX family protein